LLAWWTSILAPCFFFSPFLGCFLFIKVGRVSSFKTTKKEKGEGKKKKKKKNQGEEDDEEEENQEEEDPEEEEENTRQEKACYNGIFDRTTRNPKP
jgi:UPF0716 family protein affecting phage T7 exclusion